MREEIKESISRMSKEDCEDVKITLNLKSSSKKDILKEALADENIAEYVLNY